MDPISVAIAVVVFFVMVVVGLDLTPQDHLDLAVAMTIYFLTQVPLILLGISLSRLATRSHVLETGLQRP